MPRTLALLLLCLWLGAAAGPARADAAAGRAAYEKGDWATAMSEWQRGADKGDADAEFGLGQLYEFGLGDVTQNYKRADYWYQLAAKQGHSEAEYRLALMWSAGSTDQTPDLAEAYQWAVLAAGSEGVWSGRAGELKAQIETAANPQQQAEGKKRAAAWKAAVAAPPIVPATPPIAVVPSAPPGPVTHAPPISPTPKASGGGCPGWPFPTLPCTEQFPALPGVLPPIAPKKPAHGTDPSAATQPDPPVPTSAPPPAVTPVAMRPPAAASPAEKPIDRLNAVLAQIDCAAIEARAEPGGGVALTGTVPDAAARAKLLHDAGQVFPGRRPALRVEVVPPPICRTLAELAALKGSGALAGNRLDLKLANGATELHQGDAIELSVGSPGYAAELRIDYFSLNGNVLHLWPTAAYPTVGVEAVGGRLFWDAGGGKTWNAGGAPFGTELVTAIATPAPLALGPRPASEPAANYLRTLKQAVERAPAAAATPNVLATLLVKTGPR